MKTRWVRAALVVGAALLLLLIGLAVVLAWWQPVCESRLGGGSRAVQPTAAATGSPRAAVPRPNIVFVFADQLRHDWVNASWMHTPTMKMLAHNGTAWTAAIVASPYCAPSRACLAAQRQYDFARMPWRGRDYDVRLPTFYTQLQAAGYTTATVGKHDLASGSRIGNLLGRQQPNGTYNFDRLGFSGGFGELGSLKEYFRYVDSPFIRWLARQESAPHSALDVSLACGQNNRAICTNKTFREHWHYDTYIGGTAIQVIDAHNFSDAPLFLQIGFEGPHTPFLSTATTQATVAGRRLRAPVCQDSAQEWLPPCTFEHTPDARRIPCNYAALVEGIDAQIARVWSRIEARGQADNTVLCLSSDHGEMLGDRALVGKQIPWGSSVRVPLVCAGPGFARGAVHTRPVPMIDIGATFLDLAGAPPVPAMQTTSLLAPNRSAVVVSGLGPWRMVVAPHEGTYWKLACCDRSWTQYRDLSCNTGFVQRLLRSLGFYNPQWVAPFEGGAESSDGAFVWSLFDFDKDPYDLVNMARAKANVSAALRQHLPGRFRRHCGQQ